MQLSVPYDFNGHFFFVSNFNHLLQSFHVCDAFSSVALTIVKA
jgi:hypothetical protein